MSRYAGPAAPKWNEHRTAAWIWPSDRKQKKRRPFILNVGRWKDLLTYKGPAIYAGNRYRTAPHRPEWSNWSEHDNLGYPDVDETVPGWDGNVNPNKVYDFRTRKYKTRRPGLWSDAKRGTDGQVWYHRDWLGREYAYGRPPGRIWNDYRNRNEYGDRCYPRTTNWNKHVPEWEWYAHHPDTPWPGHFIEPYLLPPHWYW